MAFFECPSDTTNQTVFKLLFDNDIIIYGWCIKNVEKTRNKPMERVNIIPTERIKSATEKKMNSNNYNKYLMCYSISIILQIFLQLYSDN